MILYRRHNRGISLIEVIIALAMIALVVTVLLTTQGRAFDSGLRSVDEQKIVLLIRKKWTEIDMQEPEKRLPFTQSLPDDYPPGTIAFSIHYPDKKTSSLAPYKNIRIERVQATWQRKAREETLTMVRYRYHNLPSQEEQKSLGQEKDAIR